MSSPLSPSYDNKIAKKYSARTLESKLQNKLTLQRSVGFVVERKVPLLCIPGGMTDDLGGNLLKEVLPGILSQNCQIIVRGVGSPKYGELFTALESEYSHRIRIIKDEDELRRRMYAGSDMALFFAATSNTEEIRNCLSYGVVPVCPPHELLSDYNPVQESGNAFIAKPENAWGWFAAFVRALETCKLPYDWRTIEKHCMESVKEQTLDEEEEDEEPSFAESSGGKEMIAE